MANFKAFKPEAMERIARSMGHQGDMNQFQNFLLDNPDKGMQMQNYNTRAMQMARGGVVIKMQEGGTTPPEDDSTTTPPPAEQQPLAGSGDDSTIMGDTIGNIKDPKLPKGGELKPSPLLTDDSQEISKGEGDLDTLDKGETKKGDTFQADAPPPDIEPETYDPTKVAGTEPKAGAEQTEITDDMLVKAAQGTLSVEEQKAFAAALQAGQAEVSYNATVMGRLEEMGKQAEDGTIPAYSRAAVRAAMGAMASRGLGSSTMATGAIFNAIMESSIPIAKQDALTFAEYGLKNATNAQNALLAKAAALSTLNIANLNNRQQASVENSKRFLEVDLANMEARQQTEIFNTKVQADFMLSDQAEENAAKQFNATSKMEVDQFMANIATAISQFNATQLNAMEQFNTGEENAMSKFNLEIENQRQQFEANNQLAISQFNAKWKQQVVTTDNAAVNYANEFNAKALLDISNTAYENMWNHMGDLMEWAWTSGESGKDRLHEMSLAEIDAKLQTELAHLKLDAAASGAIGGFIVDLFTSPIGGSIVGNYLEIPPIP